MKAILHTFQNQSINSFKKDSAYYKPKSMNSQGWLWCGNIFFDHLPNGKSGGGRPDMAQAGGPMPENVKQALEKLKEIL